MAKVILTDIDKLDFRTTFVEHTVIDTITQATSDDTTYVIDNNESNVQAVTNYDGEVYIPITELTDDVKSKNVHVYFDLANHSFFQTAKGIIEREEKPKGVFRFRRITKETNKDALMASDLFVMSQLIGDPEDVKVNQTNLEVTPSHVILMINFGGGTMAHMEYTFVEAGEENIQFEWSGVKNIIDFDSATQKAIEPSHHRNIQLIYPLDAVIASAQKVDDALVDRMKEITEFISGGAK